MTQDGLSCSAAKASLLQPADGKARTGWIFMLGTYTELTYICEPLTGLLTPELSLTLDPMNRERSRDQARLVRLAPESKQTISRVTQSRHHDTPHIASGWSFPVHYLPSNSLTSCSPTPPPVRLASSCRYFFLLQIQSALVELWACRVMRTQLDARRDKAHAAWG